MASQKYIDYFKGKKITLMRIGLLGRGVGDAAFLAECGADVLVVDDAPQNVMQSSVDALKNYKNISYKFGKYDLADFRNCDLILKGAGAALHSPEIAEAKKHNIPVRMSADLFASLAGIPIVGVTGTRGKSTVTGLLARILSESGQKVLLGGNVKGVSTLSLLKEVTPDSIAVLELDSWQLQGFGEAKISPQVAVFTTFMPDHLNYYKGDMKAYFADKANVFLFQDSSDSLILGEQVVSPLEQYGYKDKVQARVTIAGVKSLPKSWKLQLPGEHNRYNAALALGAARALGIDDDDIRTALESFKGVPGRLELVRELNGVKIYNDTTATVPEATIAALEALDPENKKNIILIMGGADKTLDMSRLTATIPRHCKKVLLLAGTGTERIKNDIEGKVTYQSLPAAVKDALALATSGDTILFSPAFASFGMFKNEYDRGEQFNKLVEKL